MKAIILILVGTAILTSCEGQAQKNSKANPTIYAAEFGNYWYQGKAELNSYTLSQARYGELREGEAVLIFVTEDFSKSKQVKLDDPYANQKDAVKVLKLNTTRKFNTGVYPYSMMESVFTPVDSKNYPNTLKVTTSSQEWCGHTFSQINLDKDQFRFSGKSYFESEGDEESAMSVSLLESELFNLIRLNPSALPQGEIDIVPSGFFTRLSHIKTSSQKAKAEIKKMAETSILKIDYSDIQRSVSIEFANAFPYEIQGWSETYKSGFGSKAKVMTTSAQKKKTILLDYWSRNSVSDSIYRKDLLLD